MYRRGIRAGLLILLLAAPAQAGVFGDVMVGAGLMENSANLSVGARAGVAGDSIGAMVGAEWRHPVLAPQGEEVTRTEERFRTVTSGLLRFTGSTNASIIVRGGIGLELARRETSSFTFVTREWNHGTDHFTGAVLEAGVGYLHDAGSFELGVDLAASASSYSGMAADLLLIARFGR